MIGSSYPILNFFWTMLFFFVFILWIFLLIQVIVDVFRSRDLGGLSKALWLLFIIVLPFLGVLIYLIARGGKMHQHQEADAKNAQDAFNNAVRQAGGTSVADELHKLSDLKAKGVLSDAEFESAKAKLIS
jgi:ABC-type multidrug transport system fused ATPase/permease subunit